jgi:hypothetical protein
MLTTRKTVEELSALLRLLKEEKYDVKLLTESRAAALAAAEGGQRDE